MRGLGLLLLAALALGGCNKANTDTVDDAALDAISEAVETSLNEPGQAIWQLLKTLDRPSPIGFEAMSLSLDQRLIPVDWWLWRHGYVQEIVPSPAPGQPTFLVTEAARQQLAAAPAWFEAEAGEPTDVDCQSPAALEAMGCEVEVTVTPTLTATGKGVASVTILPPIKVHALVAPAADGWEVRDLRADGPGLHDVALNAILGNEPARQAARQLAMNELDVRKTASLATAALTEEAGRLPPPPPIDPVVPELGDTPYAPRPGLGR